MTATLLSRIAENMYWLGRYVERAENTARLLGVNYLALIETPDVEGAPDIVTEQWAPLLDSLGARPAFREYYSRADARSVPTWLAVHPGNTGSVRASLMAARENARALRERISTEMWEVLNRSYHALCVKDVSVLEEDALHDYCEAARETSHLFFGIAQATLPHDTGWYFLRAGQYLERADNTLRTLQVRLGETVRPSTSTPVAQGVEDHRNMALLKSLSAYEAFRKRYNAGLEPRLIADYLLLDGDFPRSVRYSVEALHLTVQKIQRENGGVGPARRAGSLAAKLSYLENVDRVIKDETPGLAKLLAETAAVSDALAEAYFSRQHQAAWQLQQ